MNPPPNPTAPMPAAPADPARRLAEAEQARRVLLSVVEDHRRAEDRLRQSQAQLRTIFQASPLGTSLFSPVTGQIVDVNERFIELTGYAREEVLGRSGLELGLWNDPADRERLLRAVQGGVPVQNFEARIRTKQGRVFDALLQAQVIELDTGPVVMVQALDFTERKRQEEALRASEERFALFMRHLPALAHIADHDGRLLFVNDAYGTQLGMSPAAVVGRTARDFIPAEAADRLLANVRWVLDHGQPLESVETLPLPGGPRTFRVHRFPLPRAGQPSLLGAIAVDITGQLASERALREKDQLLRQVIDLVPVFIFAKDRNSRFLFANRAAAEAVGMAPGELVGLTDLDLPRSRAEAEAFMRDDREVIASGQPKFVSEEILTDSAGHVRIHQTSKIPFTDPGTGEPAVLGVAVDITERKRAELLTAASHERALRQRAAMSRMVFDEPRNHGDAPTALRRLTEEVSAALQVERASVWLMSEDGGEMRCVELFEAGAKRHSEGAVLLAANYPRYWRALQTEARVNADDAVNDPRTSEFAEGYLKPLGITSMLDAILQMDGQVAGVLCLEHTGAPRHWEADEESFANTASALVTQILASTERHRVEAVLREREHVLAESQRIAHIGSWVCDLAGRMSWSAESYRIYGVSPDTFTPSFERLLNLIHPADRPAIRQRMAEGFGGAGVGGLEYRTIRPDGTVRWLLGEGELIRDAEGRPLHLAGTVQDITERKRAEAEVRASEARFRALVEQSVTGIYVAQDERFVYVNPRFCEILGWTAAELASRPAYDFILPEDRALARGNVEKRISGAVPSIHYQLRMLHATGRVVLVDAHGSRAEHAGRPAILGTLIDITERQRAEEAERESQLRMRLATEATGVGIWEWNVLTNQIRWDAQMFRIYGIAPTDGGFVDYGDWSGAVLPEDLRRQEEILQDTVRRLGSSTREFRIRRRDDGECRHLVATETVRTDAQGQAQWVVGTNLDITARKRAEAEVRASEERFRELAENINEVFWITSADKTRVIYISPAYGRIWGRTCASLYESPGTWLDAVHPEDRERVRLATESKQASGDYNETYRIVRTDGEVRWIHEQAFPVKDQDEHGAALRVVGVAEDITERRQLEAQLRESQKLEAVGTLAGGIAHDFNNILGAILGNAQLAVADTAPGHPARESLEEIRKAGQRARELVRQILAFSRRQAPERRVLAPGPVVTEAVRLLRATIPAGVELVTTVAPGVPAVLADPTQLHQVLVNLGTNAWHALGERPGRIEFGLRPVTLDAAQAAALGGLRPGRHACLSVSDNGQGIDSAVRPRLFEPFFTTKEPGQGTGLGLSVVHGIVQAHEGAITVTSEPGQGATFAVYLPAAADAGPAAEAAPGPAAAPGGHRHVLVLDDEAALVLLARRLLGRLGHRVSGFTRPAEALAAFRAGPEEFDLVLTDYNMPGVSGLAVAAEFLSLRPELPVLLNSGHVTDELHARALAAGVREVLRKPNTLEELAEAVQRHAPEPPPGGPAPSPATPGP